jgi:hypothetical protein
MQISKKLKTEKIEREEVLPGWRQKANRHGAEGAGTGKYLPGEPLSRRPAGLSLHPAMFIKPPKLRKPEPITLSEAISRWIEENRLGDKLGQTEIKELWPVWMGPAVARYTRSIRIENKILKIEVTSAPLRQQLSMSRSQIVRMVNENAGRQLVVECLIF